MGAAKLVVTGEQILDALETRLQYMLDCENLIFDLVSHPSKPLEATLTDKELSQWDRDGIQGLVRYVENYRGETEMLDAKNLRPVERLLAELPRLKKAADALKRFGILRYRLPDEDLKALYARNQRSLRQRLDTLTEFDDSE